VTFCSSEAEAQPEKRDRETHERIVWLYVRAQLACLLHGAYRIPLLTAKAAVFLRTLSLGFLWGRSLVGPVQPVSLQIKGGGPSSKCKGWVSLGGGGEVVQPKALFWELPGIRLHQMHHASRVHTSIELLHESGMYWLAGLYNRDLVYFAMLFIYSFFVFVFTPLFTPCRSFS